MVTFRNALTAQEIIEQQEVINQSIERLRPLLATQTINQSSDRREIVSKIEFTQEPPRCRTILFRGAPVYMAFPWVSIGFSEISNSIWAFFHNQEWRTIDEALEVFRQVPRFCHPICGYVCVGLALYEVLRGKITPAQAFWMTEADWGDDDYMESMKCIAREKRLGDVLKINWRDYDWSGEQDGGGVLVNANAMYTSPTVEFVWTPVSLTTSTISTTSSTPITSNTVTIPVTIPYYPDSRYSYNINTNTWTYFDSGHRYTFDGLSMTWRQET